MKNNKELNEALDKLGYGKVEVVDIEDTIKFNCKRCGKCCTNRSDIILNPYDVYRIAKALNMTMYEVISKYCKINCGCNSFLPIVTLSEDKRGLCPFLEFIPKDGKFGCSINDSKPGACIMHPIGSAKSIDKTTGEIKTQFIKVESCDVHGTETEIKIKDFIKPYLDNKECHDNGLILMHEPLKYVNLEKFVKGYIDKDEETINKYFSEQEKTEIEKLEKLRYNDILITMGYETYLKSTTEALYSFSTEKGFMEQLDEVKQNIKSSCFSMLAVYRLMGIDFSDKDISEEDINIINGIMDNMKEGVTKND